MGNEQQCRPSPDSGKLLLNAVVQDHSSNPSWPALDQGIQLLADMPID